MDNVEPFRILVAGWKMGSGGCKVPAYYFSLYLTIFEAGGVSTTKSFLKGNGDYGTTEEDLFAVWNISYGKSLILCFCKEID